MQKQVEFRFYEIPDRELVLALTGKTWHKAYGEGPDRLHFHNYFELGYCYEGEGQMTFGEDLHTFGPGCISVIPPTILHTTNTAPGTIAHWEWLYFDLMRFLEILFPGNEKLQKQYKAQLHKKAMLFNPTDSTERMAFILQRILSETHTHDLFYQDMIQHLLGALLIDLIRIEKTLQPYSSGIVRIMGIEPALEYVRTRYASSIKISNLAECCSMSESHFRKKFVEYMNMKPMDYINYIRIDRSCILLRTTNMTLEEISQQVGYESLSSFMRNFKKVTDSTPHQWKKTERIIELKYNITARPGWLK